MFISLTYGYDYVNSTLLVEPFRTFAIFTPPPKNLPQYFSVEYEKEISYRCGEKIPNWFYVA